MQNGGRSMRAFRPSHIAPHEGLDEDKEQVKQANVLRYSKRVAEGLPLFEALGVGDSKDALLQFLIPGRR